MINPFPLQSDLQKYWGWGLNGSKFHAAFCHCHLCKPSLFPCQARQRRGFKIPKGNQHINNFVLINTKENIQFNGYCVRRKMNKVRVQVLFGEYISPVKPQSHLFLGDGVGPSGRKDHICTFTILTIYMCVSKLHHYSQFQNFLCLSISLPFLPICSPSFQELRSNPWRWDLRFKQFWMLPQPWIINDHSWNLEPEKEPLIINGCFNWMIHQILTNGKWLESTQTSINNWLFGVPVTSKHFYQLQQLDSFCIGYQVTACIASRHPPHPAVNHQKIQGKEKVAVSSSYLNESCLLSVPFFFWKILFLMLFGFF